jgi:hypothetical protein
METVLTAVPDYTPENAYTQTPAVEAVEQVPAVDEALEVAALAPAADLEVPAVESETASDAAALDVTAVTDQNAETEADIEIETELAAVIASPRPALRPTSRAVAAASSSGTDISLDAVAGDILNALGAQGELSASEVPVGARLVQFGAFQNADIARQEWDRLALKFEEFMDGKSRVIEVAESGGKTFYRLRAHGFADAAESNRFCAALTSRNAACVPVRQR